MFIPPTIRENLDIEPLVQATDGFSPADIEYAARSASQAAFERALANGHSAEDLAPTIGTTEGPSVDDYLSAISQTRATVSAEVAREFEEDIEALART